MLNNKNSPFDLLENEMLFHIFSYLESPQDIETLSLVCKRFFMLIASNAKQMLENRKELLGLQKIDSIQIRMNPNDPPINFGCTHAKIKQMLEDNTVSPFKLNKSFAKLALLNNRLNKLTLDRRVFQDRITNHTNREVLSRLGIVFRELLLLFILVGGIRYLVENSLLPAMVTIMALIRFGYSGAHKVFNKGEENYNQIKITGSSFFKTYHSLANPATLAYEEKTIEFMKKW